MNPFFTYQFRLCVATGGGTPASAWSGTAGAAVPTNSDQWDADLPPYQVADPSVTVGLSADGRTVHVSWTPTGHSTDYTRDPAVETPDAYVVRLEEAGSDPAGTTYDYYRGGESPVGTATAADFPVDPVAPGTRFYADVYMSNGSDIEADGSTPYGGRFGVGSASVVIGPPDPARPASPTGLVATLTGADAVSLHWADNSADEDGFDVYRSADPAFATDVDLVTTTGADQNQYTDTLPDDTTTYYYEVYSHADAGAGADADAAATPMMVPASPQATRVTGPVPRAGDSANDTAGQQGGIRLQAVQFGSSVNFSGSTRSAVNASQTQSISRDNGTGAYSGPQWDDVNADGTIQGGPSTYLDGTIDPGTNGVTNEHDWPVSYERTDGVASLSGTKYEWTGMIATPTFAFAGVLGGALWVVRGASNVVGIRGTDITFGEAQLTASGPGQLSAVAYANQPLPDTIQSEQMKIDWQVSFDGGKTWVELAVGKSQNWLYVTGGPASGAFETELWLGCSATDLSPGSQSQDDAVVNKIWGKFAGPANVVRVDSKPLSYYKSWTTSNHTAASLLQSLDGQCGSWANLFLDCIKEQGAATSNTAFVKATPTNPNYGMAIKNFNGLTGTLDHPSVNISSTAGWECYNAKGYLWSAAQVTDAVGVAGQNNTDPLSMFYNHQFIKNDDTYYDPSYGITYTSPDDFASKAVAGLWRNTGKKFYFWTIGGSQIVFHKI